MLQRALITLLVFAFFTVAPIAAQDVSLEGETQDAPQTPEYPTVAALETAIIPPRDRVELAERLRGVSIIPATPVVTAARQVGERQVFTAANNDTVFTIPATLRVVGDHIYLWVEDGARVTDADLLALAYEFDTVIYPRVRALWGSESTPGIDGDPRIYGLFAHGLGAAVGAYFASDNTYPREVAPASNQHEMFFFNLDTLGSSFFLPIVSSTVAHEFQHMIRANMQSNSETWLNEGLSTFTEYALYGNLDSTVITFLNQPGTQLNDWNADPMLRAPNYGAATLFMIYLDQRYGLDTMRSLSAERDQRGLQAVDDTLRALAEPGVDEFFADWVLANLLLDPDYDDGRYGYAAFPPLLSSRISVSTYPYTLESSVNQYAATYHSFTGLSSYTSLNIRLDTPESASLIATSAPSGEHFWYSNRADMSDLRLTRSFDLSGVESATLSYRLWYDLEQMWDYGYVMVSDDDGATWDILQTPHTTTDDAHHVAYGAGYTGASGTWVEETLPLDAYTGENVLVRFELISDDAVTRPGIALDDVRIPEIGYLDDFEIDGGGWLAEGWLRTDNRLPQDGWLQVAQLARGEIISVERFRIGDGEYNIALAPGVDQVLVALSPFSPVTTVPMPYTLKVAPR